MRFLALPLLLSMVACGADVDTDGDGLTDREEEDFGSDPNVADTDGDGLSDLGEQTMGTSPITPDSDGDGYLDGWEVAEGTNPADPNSRIYTGNWPYNPDKDSMVDPGFGSPANVGDTIGRVLGQDQYGEVVDLWDYAGQGKPIIVDISAQWCPPCQNTSSWLSGGSDPYGLEGQYAAVRAAVNAGDIYWVTLMIEDSGGGDADAGTSAEWDAAYPNHAVPVIADPGAALMGQLQQNGLPNLHTIDDQMVLQYRNDNQSTTLDFQALDTALQLAGL